MSTRAVSGVTFHSLVLSAPRSLAKGRGLTLVVSVLVHCALLAAAVVAPFKLSSASPGN